MDEHSQHLQESAKLDEIARLANDSAKSVDPTKEDDKEEQTLSETVSKIVTDANDDGKSSEAADDTTDDVRETEEERLARESQAQETEEEKVEETAAEKAKREADELKENERLDKHPRFQELNTKVQQLEPLAKSAQLDQQFCQQWNIAPEQKKQAMELAALVNTNPKEAIKSLTELVEQLKLSTGEALPKDLAAEVEAGTMSKDRATELHMLRLQKEQSTVQQKRMTQTQQEQHEAALRDGLNVWGSLKARSDADFKPKAKATDPDGKFEVTFNQIRLLSMENFPKTVGEAQAIADKAYAYANQIFSRTQRVPRARRVLNGDGGSSNHQNGDSPEEGETMAQFVARTTGRQYGLSITTRN